MDIESKVFELLNSDNNAYDVHEINDYLGFSSVEELKELLRVLNKLEDELKIYRTKKDKYILFNNSNLRIGKMLANKKGYGFVDIEGPEDVFVAPTNMNNAIHGDTVVVEIISKKGLELEGRIVRIVERSLKQVVGEIYHDKGNVCVKLDDEKLKITIIIDKDRANGVVDGHKVLVKITSKLKGNEYKGEIIKILGHKNDPGVDILSIVAKYNIPDTFSSKTIAELDDIPEFVKDEEMKGRKDLRNEVIFTIDGDDTKDIDDAISIEKLENGNYKLGVHIADVSYYVKEGSAIDEDAYLRGNSVYLADRVIPMIPHKLSNGICSLNPLADRLAMSCVMEIDDSGNTVNYEIFESVIRSSIQMTYKKVNLILEDNIVPSGYEPYVSKLNMMKDLAGILRKMKEKRGYIDFEIDEPKIIVDEAGKAIDVVKRNRGTGEKLIEDFMIAANETVATHIYFMDLPFLYRVHGEPEEEKITNFLKFISILGYNVRLSTSKIYPTTLQGLLGELKDKREYPILSSMLLRCMRKAVYDKNNIGHFGLGSKYYTHFTSPIRRYSDTTVHRLLKRYLFKNQMDRDTLNYLDNKLVVIGEHVSETERASIDCEREVDDMKMAEYMEGHIGENFEGIVTTITNFGMFVELPNLIEGLVRVDSMTDDYYVYDEETFSLRGEHNKKGYRLGDKVKVTVIAANKEAKTIDFIISEGDKDGNK